MNCWWCDTELIWGGDVDIEKDMGGYPEFSVLTNLSCPKCESMVEVLKKAMPLINFRLLMFSPKKKEGFYTL